MSENGQGKMIKHKVVKSKLRIQPETLRALTAEQTSRVIGGEITDGHGKSYQGHCYEPKLD